MKPVYIVHIQYVDKPPIVVTENVDDAFTVARAYLMGSPGDTVEVLEYTLGRVGSPVQLEIPK